jgi:hypothetical protein
LGWSLEEYLCRVSRREHLVRVAARVLEFTEHHPDLTQRYLAALMATLWNVAAAQAGKRGQAEPGDFHLAFGLEKPAAEMTEGERREKARQVADQWKGFFGSLGPQARLDPVEQVKRLEGG